MVSGRHIERRSAAAPLQRSRNSFVDLHAAVYDGLKLHAALLLGLAQAVQLRALPRFEKLDLLGNRFVPVLRARRRRIGRVDPVQRAFGIPEPDGHGQAVQKLFPLIYGLLQALVLADQAHKLLVDRREWPDPQHGLGAADRARDLDDLALKRARVRDETLAARLQPVEAGSHPAGIVGMKPGGKAQ